MAGLIEQVRDMQERLGERISEIDTEIATLNRERNEITAFLAPLNRSVRRGTRGRQPKRREQFIEVVTRKPGITVSEAAKEMGIAPNYLYRLSKDLVDEGSLVKEGSGYRAVAPEPEPEAEDAKTQDQEKAAA